MRSPLAIVSILVAATVVAVACGGDREAPRRPDAPAPERDRATGTASTRTAKDTCGAPPGTALLGATVPLDRARRAIDAAAAARTGAGSRFHLQLAVDIARLPTATATLSGRRLADNSSTATIDWEGVAGALLPTGELRIVDDVLLLRRTSAQPWRRLGSASGVSLDVGRELLDHPFLLRTVRARRSGSTTVLALDAPVERLRAYATSERAGPVTDLLARARSLRIVVRVTRGQLVGDRFTLVARIPPSMGGRLANRPVTIRGATGYCALRPVDRSVITAS
ncbi:MAG: hypothetical protein JWM86_607 [Thermoleophilia bacterium]|nr:hypothetical protein [Thermoleophilia bacterium]